MRHYRIYLALPLLAYLLPLVRAEQASPGAARPDRVTLCEIFLGQHLQDVNRRAAGNIGASAADVAYRLGILPEELPIIDQSAVTYAAEDKRVHEMALRHHADRRSAHKPMDRLVVHGFTLARERAAADALARIKERLSAKSFAVFLAYVESTFSASIWTVPAGQHAPGAGILYEGEQCSDGTTLIKGINGIYRTGGNNVEANVGTQVIGDYSDTWEVGVTGSETVTGTEGLATIHLPRSDSVGFGGNDEPGSAGTAAGWHWNDAPSTVGAGTYTTTTSHEAASECGEIRSASYSSSLSVRIPTIGGVSDTSAIWYLGPNTASAVQAQNGYYYY